MGWPPSLPELNGFIAKYDPSDVTGQRLTMQQEIVKELPGRVVCRIVAVE